MYSKDYRKQAVDYKDKEKEKEKVIPHKLKKFALKSTFL